MWKLNFRFDHDSDQYYYPYYEDLVSEEEAVITIYERFISHFDDTFSITFWKVDLDCSYTTNDENYEEEM